MALNAALISVWTP